LEEEEEELSHSSLSFLVTSPTIQLSCGSGAGLGADQDPQYPGVSADVSTLHGVTQECDN